MLLEHQVVDDVRIALVAREIDGAVDEDRQPCVDSISCGSCPDTSCSRSRLDELGGTPSPSGSAIAAAVRARTPRARGRLGRRGITYCCRNASTRRRAPGPARQALSARRRSAPPDTWRRRRRAPSFLIGQLRPGNPDSLRLSARSIRASAPPSPRQRPAVPLEDGPAPRIASASAASPQRTLPVARLPSAGP